MKFYICALVVTIFSCRGAIELYIPSYDDRYSEDIQEARSNKNFFQEPADDLNYADYHYVGAHAAEKYPRFVTQYFLQEQTVPGMLSLGVRGLMLSVYNWLLYWSSIYQSGISVVCSNPTKETTVFRKNGKPLYQTLHYEMNRIFNFLKTHPKAVITIVLEDYADIAKVTRDLEQIFRKNNYDPLLKPADWAPARDKGAWPTLGWMRSHNKRLVIFTQFHTEHTNLTWPMRHYFWQNNPGTIDPKLMCLEEKESLKDPHKKNRKLVSFSCIGGTATVPAARAARGGSVCFEYENAKDFTQICQQKSFAQGKAFNAYWADHVIREANNLARAGRKTVFDYVNEKNRSKK